jgi:SAM-dependent methyltransferase
MGPETGFAAEAAHGKLVTLVSSQQGAELWAASYDLTPNPLLALEMRCAGPQLTGVRSLLDVGCGTGRWMTWAEERGIRAFGIDASRAMLMHTAAHLRGRCAQATLTRVPIKTNAVNVVVCSFVLSYVTDLGEAFRELARTASKVLVSDLHPAADTAGWKRGFRVAGETYELDHIRYSMEQLDWAAGSAGLKRRWRMESRFGEPERSFFVDAGKAADFDDLCKIPAVLATLWERD